MGEVERILDRLRASETKDGPSLLQQNLYVGLATARVARGDYAGSIDHMRHAAELASRAGSPTREASAYSNLTVSHFRLGDTSAALECARQAQRIIGGTAHSAARCGVIGVELCCHALSNNTPEFNTSLTAARAYSESGLSPAIALLAQLWISDGLYLAGERDRALESAAHALSRLEVLPIAWLGVIVRWAGVLLPLTGSQALKAIVASGVEKLDKVDALDRLEIAQTALLVLNPTPEQETAFRLVIGNTATALPPFTVRLLRRLGLLFHPTPALPQDAHPAA